MTGQNLRVFSGHHRMVRKYFPEVALRGADQEFTRTIGPIGWFTQNRVHRIGQNDGVIHRQEYS